MTGLNTSFYIGFVFLFSDTYSNHLWVLLSLQKFYQENIILNPILIGTNCEKAIIYML